MYILRNLLSKISARATIKIFIDINLIQQSSIGNIINKATMDSNIQVRWYKLKRIRIVDKTGPMEHGLPVTHFSIGGNIDNENLVTIVEGKKIGVL